MTAAVLASSHQTFINAALQNAVAKWPRKQFGMYGNDVETHLAAKLIQRIVGFQLFLLPENQLVFPVRKVHNRSNFVRYMA